MPCSAGRRRGAARAGPASCRSTARRRAPRSTRSPPASRPATRRSPRTSPRRSSTATGPRREAVLAYGMRARPRPARSSTGCPYLEAEIAWAADRELAQSLDDLLARRIRLVHTLPDRGASIAPAGGRRSPATCSAGTRIARPRRSRTYLDGGPPGVRNPGLTGASTPPDEGQRRGAQIGYRHGYGMCVDCPRARHRARLRLDRTFDTLVSSGQHLQRGRPGQRRRQTEEIGTWPTRP